MSVQIDPLVSLHSEIVCRLHELAFDEHWTAEDFQNLINQPGRFGFMASLENVPLGFVLCQGDDQECEIITIATHPEKRRQKIGSHLIEAIFKKSDKVFLEVALDNPAAISFYKKLGFKEIAQRKNYYKRPNGLRIDALVMQSGR